MSALIFLAFAVVVCLVGFGVLYLRSRQPTSLESGIDAFQREMNALSPDEVDDRPGSSGGVPRSGSRGSRQPPTRPIPPKR
jgi:hypothetical protein